MTILEVVREIPVAAGLAFDAIVDLASQDRWMVATTLRVMDGPVPPPAVGSRIAARTGLGPLGFVDTMEVVGFVPGESWEVRHTGSVVKGRGLFAVAATGARTCRVSWLEEFDLPLGALGRWGWPLARPFVAAGLRASLNRLAAGLVDGSLPVNATR
jgi:hypothetical protein